MYFAVDANDAAELAGHWTAAIADAMAAGTPAGTARHWTALVDGAFDYGREPVNYPGAPVPLYAYEALDDLLAVSPLLIPLATAPLTLLQDQLIALIRHCAGRPMLSVVGSARDALALRKHWQQCARATMESGQTRLLRFADTRVLPALADVLRPDAWATLTHGLEHWWYPDRQGNSARLPVTGPRHPPILPLVIGRGECARLAEWGEPDAVIDAMVAQVPDIVPHTNRAAFFERMREVCQFARERDIDAFADKVALAIFDTVRQRDGLSDAALLALLDARAWQPGELASQLVEMAG